MPRCKYAGLCETYSMLQIDFRASLCGEFEDLDRDYKPRCLSFVGVGLADKLEEFSLRNQRKIAELG